jgi:hypothetical protein
MRLNFRIVLETPAVFDVPEDEGKIIHLSTSLKGRIRSNLEKFLGADTEAIESIFGSETQSAKVFFKDIPFEGIPFTRYHISISRDPEKFSESNLFSEKIVPETSSLMGEVLTDDQISDSQLTLIKESILYLQATGIGKNRTTGFGRCKVEFVDLDSVGEIFISYSWEELEHNDWVLQLANRLTKDGINVTFDRYDLGIGDNIPVFMENAVEKANKVLIVLTPKYKEKADKREGGVGYEYSLINFDLFQKLASNDKILPILRKGSFDQSIPKILRQYFICDMRDDIPFERNYSELFSSILGKKPVERPKKNVGQ